MLYFVDESGHDLKQAPYSVLAAVGLSEASVWPFATAFSNLMRDLLRIPNAEKYEAKGSKLLTRRVFALAGQRSDFGDDQRDALIDALHTKNATGTPATRDELAALSQAKLLFVDRALDLAARSGARTFLSMVPRTAPQQRDESFLRKDFSYLFQRVHCDVSDHDHREQGLLVFDELDPHLCRRLIGQMRQYFVGTGRGEFRAERIVPLPFFVRSDLTPPIQLADIVAYVGNWGLRMPRMEEPARPELRPYADKIFQMRYVGRERPHMLPRRLGRQIWGIAHIPDLRPRSEIEEDPVQAAPEPGAA